MNDTRKVYLQEPEKRRNKEEQKKEKKKVIARKLRLNKMLKIEAQNETILFLTNLPTIYQLAVAEQLRPDLQVRLSYESDKKIKNYITQIDNENFLINDSSTKIEYKQYLRALAQQTLKMIDLIEASDTLIWLDENFRGEGDLEALREKARDNLGTHFSGINCINNPFAPTGKQILEEISFISNTKTELIFSGLARLDYAFMKGKDRTNQKYFRVPEVTSPTGNRCQGKNGYRWVVERINRDGSLKCRDFFFFFNFVLRKLKFMAKGVVFPNKKREEGEDIKKQMVSETVSEKNSEKISERVLPRIFFLVLSTFFITQVFPLLLLPKTQGPVLLIYFLT